MDPLNDEQIDFGDEECRGSQKMPYHQAAAIPALADEEMIGEEDEYDDLYNDVNVGESFMQMQQAEAQMPPSGVGNGGIQASKDNVQGTRVESMASQEANKARVANEGKFAPSGVHHPEQNPGWPSTGGHVPSADASQRGKLPEMTPNSQARNFGYPGVMPQSADRVIKPEKAVNDPLPLPNQNMGSTTFMPQIQLNTMNPNPNANMNRSVNDEYQTRPGVENGNNMLFVGELHWWTTDAELESTLIQYGRVKEIKFFDERASGKSKGYCQVEFYDPASAAACKDGMDGHMFNGRACVVTFATSHSIKQMGASYNRNQSQVQPPQQGRNNMNDGGGRGNGTNYAGGDGGRNFGRGGWGRNGNQFPNRGPAVGPMRGRAGMGNRNMMGNAPGGGGGGAFGQGLGNPGFGGPPGMMHPQGGMMGPGFDLAYMGRGAGYGGFPGPSFPGMMPPFPAMNSMGLPGVAPHVNPAFFGRGMTPNGMNMMGTGGMEVPHSGMWNDPNMGGWGGEDHGRGAKESSYGGEDNGSEDGYGEGSHDKGVVKSSKGEKERNSEWSGNPEKKHREERHRDGDRYEMDQRYREDKDRNRDYRRKDRDTGYDDDYDRGHSSSRPRSRSRAVPEDNHGSRSRDAEYGKRRRMPSE